MELIAADGTLAVLIGDDAHTMEETRFGPGVYLSKGHALLVGTDRRGQTVNLAVMDLGGVIQVGGIDVSDPDHLDALADHFHERARKMRQRQTNPLPH